MIEEFETRTSVGIAVPRTSLVMFRRIMYENGITLQEFISQIIRMVVDRDPKMKAVLEAAKSKRIANNKPKFIYTTPQALYSALEQKNPLKNKE